MQKIQDLQDKIFFEVKNILESLSKLENTDELLRKSDLFRDLEERVYFLKVLDKNISVFEEEETIPVSNDVISSEEEVKIEEESTIVEQESLEEEVIFNNELNEIGVEDKEPEVEVTEIEEEVVLEAEETSEGESLSELDNLIIDENVEVEPEAQNIEEKAEEVIEEPPVFETNELEDKKEDKKIKLAHIRNLKAEPTLFDEEAVEKTNESSSFLKNNLSTDYMEAQKQKPEFKLDINDKIAFSKKLFGGSQDDLNQVIRELNTFETLDEAKEFLSEMYYDRKWDKVDEYAQRLWALVESKFM